MEHVSQNMTSFLRTKLKAQPVGVDVKDVSFSAIK